MHNDTTHANTILYYTSRKKKGSYRGPYIFDTFKISEQSFLFCSKISLEAKNKSTV